MRFGGVLVQPVALLGLALSSHPAYEVLLVVVDRAESARAAAARRPRRRSRIWGGAGADGRGAPEPRSSRLPPGLRVSVPRHGPFQRPRRSRVARRRVAAVDAGACRLRHAGGDPGPDRRRRSRAGQRLAGARRGARAARADGVPAPLLDADRIGGRLPAASGQGLAAQGACVGDAPADPHGAPGFELTPELEPRASEAVIDKITMSAFEGTPLDIVLRDCGVRAYLIVGVALEVGIEPTVRHSADLGYVPVVVRDACGAGDPAAAQRTLDALAFAGDAILADTDAVTTSLIGATPKDG